MHKIAKALGTILDETSASFLERRAVVEAVLMAVLSKEHVFILGPPGTAKSALIRAIISRFDGASYYESLLSKTRPDAAVLGPYDLPLLREQGSFKRKTAGFLPTANFAMLDEIGKMSPTLGHDLLAVLNERLLHEVNGARSAQTVPLYTAIGASNELIVEESEDAAALWDRLLVRVVVDYIQEDGNFASLLELDAAPTGPVTTVPWLDLQRVIDEDVPAIEVPTNVIETIIRLRHELRSAEITVSDRRWRQCKRLMQASAFLGGRTQVEDDDMHVLRYALWDGPEQITTVERLALSLSNPIAEKCLGILDDAEQLAAGIRDRKGQSVEARAAFGAEANGKLKTLLAQTNQVRQECLAAGRSTTKVDEVLDRLAGIKKSIYLDMIGIDPSMLKS